MKSFRKELWFNVEGRREFINITQDVYECIQECGDNSYFNLKSFFLS